MRSLKDAPAIIKCSYCINRTQDMGQLHFAILCNFQFSQMSPKSAMLCDPLELAGGITGTNCGEWLQLKEHMHKERWLYPTC